MSIGAIVGLGSYVQSLLGTTGSKSTSGTTDIAGSSSSTSTQDTEHLSPFAQLLNTLQKLQQTDPTAYQQVTQQIAANLQSAGKTAQASGNTGQANELNQLAADFSSASQSGQLPNVQDLAQAVGGHHHGHHHYAGSDTGTSSSSGTDQVLSQYLAALQSASTQTDALNPMSIISSALSAAGITGASS